MGLLGGMEGECVNVLDKKKPILGMNKKDIHNMEYILWLEIEYRGIILYIFR